MLPKKPVVHSICIGTYNDSLEALVEMLVLSSRKFEKCNVVVNGARKRFSFSRFESLVSSSGFDVCELTDQSKMLSLLYCSPLSSLWPTNFDSNLDSPWLLSRQSAVLNLEASGVSRYPHIFVWQGASEEDAKADFVNVLNGVECTCLSFAIRFGEGSSTFANPLFSTGVSSENCSFLDDGIPGQFRGVKEFWARKHSPNAPC